jgi:serine protease inhibitor
LGALEAKLTSTNLQSWLGKLEAREVNVQLPKFKLETDYQKMGGTLKAMGMARAFTDPSAPGGAQFDGMCASSDPMDKLYIGAVMHKAFVEVTEKGTEAAAATGAVMMATRSMPSDMPFTPTFRADKPFVFAIRDVKTGTILFLGRVMDPTK